MANLSTPYDNERTLADYIRNTNKREAEREASSISQANYIFQSRNGMRIPCHNRATQLYYKYKEDAEKVTTNS